MQQPNIHVTDDHKDWGLKKVTQLNWSQQGHIDCILVDWYGNGRDQAPFYDYDNTGTFKNQYGNLHGKLILADL
jgi:hypothetical protein